MEKILAFLIERFAIERSKFDRSGVYAHTQRMLAYNSNKIEGSTLTPEQTASLFDHGTLPQTDSFYRAKDVEEMNGHFLMFNRMLDTLQEPLSQSLICQFHKELKSGVFEDRANGYAIGAYKERPNRIGTFSTTLPAEVPAEMEKLLTWYDKAIEKARTEEKKLVVLATFHARYESIHPFQDGNGRTGRLLLFRQCLTCGILPMVIEDLHREDYIQALSLYRQDGSVESLVALLKKEQQVYKKAVGYFMGET